MAIESPCTDAANSTAQLTCASDASAEFKAISRYL